MWRESTRKGLEEEVAPCAATLVAAVTTVAPEEFVAVAVVASSLSMMLWGSEWLALLLPATRSSP